jgi:hypothetical protein
MIYVNGCSYTFGIGTVPHGDNPTDCLRNSWPAQLSEMLDKEVINEALPGSCNERIFRDTVNYLSSNEPELVICMWSDPGRVEGYYPNQGDWYRDIFDLFQITPQAVTGITDFFLREALESYYSFIHTDVKRCLDTLSYMNALQLICKGKNIPYISHCYKSNIERQCRHTLKILESAPTKSQMNVKDKIISMRESLDDYNFGVNNVISFNNLVLDNYLPFSEYSLGHPGYEAHTFMANWFKEFIEEHDLIS